MKLFKNKFFIVCLCIAVALAALSSTFSLMGYRALARDIVGTVTLPFRWVVSAFTNAADGFGKYFSSIDKLTEHNQALQQENAELRAQIERAQRIEAENQRLRAYLDMKAAYPSFQFEEGSIIGRESSNYITVLTLNRGSIHGIQKDMPVITKEGIVGSVSEVGLTWCKVSTILETARSVGVYLPRNRLSGILSGDYSMRTEGLCRLTFVDVDVKTADVQVGDAVYSSGIGSVYPADMKVGTVVSVEIDQASRTLTATVQPEVDFSALESMMILTGYQKAE